MLFAAIDWCMISIHHWIVMSVQSLGVHLSTVLIVTVPSLFVARCSPFHCPYCYCTFTVCCSVFTFPLSLSSLYLHSLLLGVHLSTVLIVTVPSLFVARCSPFQCPHYCTFTVCLLLNVRLSTVLIVTVPSLFVAQCSPFHCPHQSLYLHCLLSSVHISTVLITVPSLSVVQCSPFHVLITVPSLSVVQCSPFHCPHYCTFTVCCPVFTFPLSSSLYLHCLLSSVHLSTSSSLYLHCLLSNVHLSTVLITVPSLSVVQCSPFHCPHHCTFTVCCPVFTFPLSSSLYLHSLLSNVHLSTVLITVPSVFVRCQLLSTAAVPWSCTLFCIVPVKNAFSF